MCVGAAKKNEGFSLRVNGEEDEEQNSSSFFFMAVCRIGSGRVAHLRTRLLEHASAPL